VRDARQLAGSRHPFDEAETRELVTRDLGRAINPQSLMNHAMLSRGEERHHRLGEIDAPFLVIHGTSDPILPHPHGVALAKAIPEATLVTLEGGGHELHEGDWDQILDAILGQTTTRSSP
jgi:pimeloyl-ACP methyl ester carboxylesterase